MYETALILLIIGGLNWGLVGLLDYNPVEAIFGVGTGLTRFIYIIVGLSAIWVAANYYKRVRVRE